MQRDFSVYRERRERLVELVREERAAARGPIVLFANFEEGGRRFCQESSFYYLTGIEEPGAVLLIEPAGSTTLFVPNYGDVRSRWTNNTIEPSGESADRYLMDEVVWLGQQCAGYQIHPFSEEDSYENLLERLANAVGDGEAIFTLCPDNPREYVTQRCLLTRLDSFASGISEACIDISPLVAQMRRQKDKSEIALLYRAAEVTMLAHQAAAQAICNGMSECEVQAHAEFIMTGSCMRRAFASVVASGRNATVLHYDENSATMRDGQLVVVDIGAEFEHYCGDITRTYPVSGSFSDRQKELYEIVLKTQEHVASIAAPGMYLNNPDEPDKSLNHRARAFMAESGYDEYFIHGIGHYLGLDVHDVGDVRAPLQAGDVITIEPGIYIPDEEIGIRIEDDYWIVQDGVVCLTEQLPKEPELIEEMVQQSIDE